jgi:penicillin amidase
VLTPIPEERIDFFGVFIDLGRNMPPRAGGGSFFRLSGLVAGAGMRKLKIIVGLIVVLIVSFGVGVYIYLRSTVPSYKRDIVAEGISDKVDIVRDDYGMPHIYAATEEDAAFGLGYCMAQDRLFQMEMLRRSVKGELSEVLGPGFVDVDRLFRTITAPRPIESIYASLPPHIAGIMEAFTAGINRYISDHDTNLPFEFALLGFKLKPWTPADEMTGLYYMAWAMNMSFHSEILYSAIIDRVGPDLAADLFAYPRNAPTIIPDSLFTVSFNRLLGTLAKAHSVTGLTFPGASNNWVVAGFKSETGLPLVANDMHLALILPNIWYEAHLVAPGINVSGVVLPGFPLVVAGANQHVAWAFTDIMADDADFYQEKINPDDSSQYEFMGRWEDMRYVYDTIAVRDTVGVPLTIRLTRHGAIIDDIVLDDSMPLPVRPVSMRWTLYDDAEEANSLYLLNRAQTIDDIEQAAKYFKCPGQNWVYADDQGNIGYWAAMGIPIRNGFTGEKILPGWDGKHEWSGYVPFDEQPHMRNPARGWIATANNEIVGDDYPYIISNSYATPDRYIRIRQMLTEKEKLSIADFERIQGDVHMVLAETWIPLILAAVDTTDLTPLQRQALDSLRGWDYSADTNRVGPTLFNVLFQKTTENVVEKRLGDTLFTDWLVNAFIVFDAMENLITEEHSPWYDDPDTPAIETRDNVLRAGFISAVDYLDSAYGGDIARWKWGRPHTLTLINLFGGQIPIVGRMMNRGPYPMNGAFNTVNAALYRLTQPFHMLAGPSQRHIFDLANTDRSQQIMPGGISGNFMSPYYADQVDLWRAVKYRPFYLERENVETVAKYRMTIIPPPADSSAGTTSRKE